MRQLERHRAQLLEPAISACANGSSATSASGGPRHSASASRSRAAASPAVGASDRRLADQPLEAVEVELAVVHPQRVAVPAGLQPPPVASPSARRSWQT